MDVNSNSKSGSDEQMMNILLVFDKEKMQIASRTMKNNRVLNRVGFQI